MIMKQVAASIRIAASTAKTNLTSSIAQLSEILRDIDQIAINKIGTIIFKFARQLLKDIWTCKTIVRNVPGGCESHFLAGASRFVYRPAAVTPSGVSPTNGLATEYADSRPDSGLLYWIRRIHNQMTKGALR